MISMLMRARLATLAWYLDESARKRNWRTRPEPLGTEDNAWKLAPSWIAAQAYLCLADGYEHMSVPAEQGGVIEPRRRSDVRSQQ